MSHAWAKVSLVELLRQISDAHPVIAGEEYPNFGILSFGRGLFSKQAISGARTSARTLFRARKGQFIYSRLFAFEGAYGLVTQEYDGHFVSNEYPMFDCDKERILPEYLVFATSNPLGFGRRSLGSRPGWETGGGEFNRNNC